jgi:soluble cytochrome b562
MSVPISVSFHVSKNYIRTLKSDDGVSIYHAYPTLADYAAGLIPDKVNPRTHGPECLKGMLPKEIRSTLETTPQSFSLINRGSTILSDNAWFDPIKEQLTITFTDYDGDDPIHGMPDGATTDAVIKDAQRDALRSILAILDEHQPLTINTYQELIQKHHELIPNYLKTARIHLEIIKGISCRSDIADISEGRNTGRQVKQWSLEDFRGGFDWLKKALDKAGYGDIVGYEEMAGKDITVLDVIAIINLFHQQYNDSCQPTISYSCKGKMLDRAIQSVDGLKMLEPLIVDILKLHDLVYSTIPKAYGAYGGILTSLCSKDGTFKKFGNPRKLPFSDYCATNSIPTGVLFPVLASMRAIISYDRTGRAFWNVPYEKFWEENKETLVNQLLDDFKVSRNPNVCGKSAAIYGNLYRTAENRYMKMRLNER